ncbi:coiled-coil domain-containing protein 103 isoform X2 [Alligator sinensis]|uniref:Coiled-coil domain-containing protein 103 isoform X2 n=1 Tax=Alligator sinensis TaxID=38654 RepID=A0A1U7S8Z3_ALLSI|nr:coiled-coil domain-containing protein 103 isoform X2 [Alligator sinensis]
METGGEAGNQCRGSPGPGIGPGGGERPGVIIMDKSGAIDFCALERELQAAVAADEKYWRENDAKFRAVHQKVASYEEFRDIVRASHLKPLEKKDKFGKKKNLLWNSCATQAKCQQNSEVEIAQRLDRLPETSSEFYRDWRRCLKSGQEKYQFLLQLGGTGLGKIFQADLGFGLLGEFLRVLAENVCGEDREATLHILQSLSETKHFGLNVDLLSQVEKESSRDLFEKLKSMNRNCSTRGLPFDKAKAGSEALGEEPSETEREMHLQGCDLGREADERRLMELMKCYQLM